LTRLAVSYCPVKVVARATHDARAHEWIQYLGMLTGIGKGGEVIQQGDAGRGSHREASIDEAPYESDFQPRRKLPPSIQAIALTDHPREA
jgi:hypothetical protein